MGASLVQDPSKSKRYGLRCSMLDHDGSPEFPIWLIGDSPPKNWHEDLDVPLDPRHPARHNIWTPVLDQIQQTVFRDGLRLDVRQLYVRNAVDSTELIPPKRAEWNWAALAPSIQTLGNDLKQHRPQLVLSFGAFACEMVCRARRAGLAVPCVERKIDTWTTKELGVAFRQGVSQYDPAGINHLPLLHVSIARRHFLSAHAHFRSDSDKKKPNYFDYVGSELGELLLKHLKDKPIWLRPGRSAAEPAPK